MLIVPRLPDELRARVRARLEEVWMPGDWFKLDDRVAEHYQTKAAVFHAAIEQRKSFPLTLGSPKAVEIGSRAGYSMASFWEVEGRMPMSWLCLDASLDDDSPACLRHLEEHAARRCFVPPHLVIVNTRHCVALGRGWFAHVDGEHTDTGVLRDLRLVAGYRCILVDDCDNPQVMKGVREWLRDHPDRECQFIDDGLRTLGVISPAGPQLPPGPQG